MSDMLPLNRLYNMDCMDGMARFPDGYFDLAITDPPYGGGSVSADAGDAFGNASRGRFDRYTVKATRTGGTWSEKYQSADNEITHWDIAPPPEYFVELFRVSKNQIIWGGNYFDLPPTRCFVVWRKLTIGESFSMAMCEYAWTSFNDNAKWIEMPPQGTKAAPRFHPTQKPIGLYGWLLGLFAKPGDKILDTHAGSASSLVACKRAGYEYVGFEIDADYYAKAQKRLDAEIEQERLDMSAVLEYAQVEL